MEMPKAERCGAFLKTAKGRFWIGTRDEGLFLMDRTTHRFVQYKGEGSSRLSNPTVRSIFEDSKGRLWLGTPNGLNSFDPDKREFELQQAEPGSSTNNTSTRSQRIVVPVS